jgi:hypothetical protein
LNRNSRRRDDFRGRRSWPSCSRSRRRSRLTRMRGWFAMGCFRVSRRWFGSWRLRMIVGVVLLLLASWGCFISRPLWGWTLALCSSLPGLTDPDWSLAQLDRGWENKKWQAYESTSQIKPKHISRDDREL